MQSFCKLIPGSQLTSRELGYVMTPDEYIRALSRMRDVRQLQQLLPTTLRVRLFSSALKDSSDLLSALRPHLMRGEWVALSGTVRLAPLSAQQLQSYPQLSNLLNAVQGQVNQVVKANYDAVTDSIPVSSASTAPAKKAAEHKIVVEFAGQWPSTPLALLLEKTDAQTSRLAKPHNDTQATHRSVAIFHNLEAEAKNLYLTIPIRGAIEPLKLKLAEGLQPVEKATEMDEWDNVLVPVRPLAYLDDNEQDKANAAELNSGYLYLFWKNTLWRELSITDKGYYRDIDVEYYRNLAAENSEENAADERKAEGFPLAQIWVPYKIAGTAQQGDDGIKMLFYPQQKTWQEIEDLESDSDALDEAASVLDALSSYSSAQAFSADTHTDAINNAAIASITDDDMYWFSDKNLLLTSLSNTNTAAVYVDGYNDSILLRVEKPNQNIELGQEPKLWALVTDSASDWQLVAPLVPIANEPYLQALLMGLPDEGKFTLMVINPLDEDGAELIFKDIARDDFTAMDKSLAAAEAAEIVEPDADALQQQQDYQEFMDSWRHLLMS